MDTQCRFGFLESKDVEVRFDGGQITTDAGLSVFIEWTRNESFISPYAQILEETDDRMPSRTDHTVEQLMRQRVLQIAAGYEDQCDSDELRGAPLFRAANGRVDEGSSNASQPTMSRWENRVDARDVVKLNRQLLEGYIESRQDHPPDEILLDIDATPAAAHGDQQLAMFDGHYGQTMYFPLMMYDGTTGELLALRLRSGQAHDTHRAKPMVRRVLRRLREAFPSAELRFRADAGFTDVGLYRLLEGFDVRWTINYASNEVLKRRTDALLEEVQTQYDRTGEHTTRYELLKGYQANTWERHRWVAAKIEAGPKGTNRRFVVCSERPDSAKAAFGFYEGRGVCEQYIKEFKGGFRGDKLSCQTFVANAFRLLLFGIGYTGIARFRAQHLTDTVLEGSWIQTIREKLFKLGARIETSVRRFWIHASEEWPYKDCFEEVARSVCPQPG